MCYIQNNFQRENNNFMNFPRRTYRNRIYNDFNGDNRRFDNFPRNNNFRRRERNFNGFNNGLKVRLL